MSAKEEPKIPEISTALYWHYGPELTICGQFKIRCFYNDDAKEWRTQYVGIKIREQPVGRNAKPYLVDVHYITIFGIELHQFSGELNDDYSIQTVHHVENIISHESFDENEDCQGEFKWINSDDRFEEIEEKLPGIVAIWTRLRDDIHDKVSLYSDYLTKPTTNE